MDHSLNTPTPSPGAELRVRLRERKGFSCASSENARGMLEDQEPRCPFMVLGGDAEGVQVKNPGKFGSSQWLVVVN